MFLCTQITAGVPTFSEVTDTAACSGYIQEQAVNFGLGALSYTEANTILGAVSLLFAVAFVFRAVLHFIQNR